MATSQLQMTRGVRTTQGRCPQCKVRHVWPAGKQAVSTALCPGCGTGLLRTTWDVNLPVQDWPLGLGVSIVAAGDDAFIASLPL